jgi:two-component system sensor histidine kinase QseC
MKLLNKSFIYLSIILFLIVSLWATIFYFNILDEIKESVDEGLENSKREIIYKVQKDTTFLQRRYFEEGMYSIKELTQAEALQYKDRYVDTVMYQQDADDEEAELEPFRMLISAFEFHQKYYELRIIHSMVEEDDLIEELFWEAILLYTVLLITIIIINNWVLQRLWKPFYDLLNQLKKYQLTDGNNQLPTVNTTTKEFEDLQNSIHVLLQKNIDAYKQQKQFIENASHELQTPLAIVIQKLELLIENGDLNENTATSLGDVLQIMDRLKRLNKSLLLISKIENKQFLERKNIDIKLIVDQLSQELEEQALYKNISIQIKSNEPLIIEIDPTLAHIIVGNLFRNALFHTLRDGEIDIRINASSLTIKNSATSPLDKNQLFKRFHKSNTTHNESTGLGLAIVKAICDVYGYKLEYSYENQMHCFSIFFA